MCVRQCNRGCLEEGIGVGVGGVGEGVRDGTGSGRSDLVNIVHSFTYTDSSPLSVLFNVPRAPMISEPSVHSLIVSNASPKRPLEGG